MSNATVENALLGDNQIYNLAGKRVFVAGHRGMLGSALRRRLEKCNCEIVTVDRAAVDLRDSDAVNCWFRQVRPHAVFATAGTVGGIEANMVRPAAFIHDNLAIALNVIHAAHIYGIEKLVFPGSSCMYPRLAQQPMREASLMTGPLEPTSEPYAIAKVAGMTLCQAYKKQYQDDFVCAIPANIYGPYDNFDTDAAHVVPALIRRFKEAAASGRDVILWGTGRARREFLYVADAADAMVFLMERYNGSGAINIGCQQDISIAELATVLAPIIGFKGAVIYDTTRPDGAPRKALDSQRIYDLGWRPFTLLEDGLARTYSWYLDDVSTRSLNERRSSAAVGHLSTSEGKSGDPRLLDREASSIGEHHTSSRA